MLDRAMKMLEIPRIGGQDFEKTTGYYIKETSGEYRNQCDVSVIPMCSVDAMYFPGRAATIYYRPPPNHPRRLLSQIMGKVEAALHHKHDIAIGSLGILHPTVLEKFEINFPCSALEFSLEPFKKQVQKIWTNDE